MSLLSIHKVTKLRFSSHNNDSVFIQIKIMPNVIFCYASLRVLKSICLLYKINYDLLIVFKMLGTIELNRKCHRLNSNCYCGNILHKFPLFRT